MAGNFGKYIDRSPLICAAGLVSGDPGQTVAKTLQDYTVEDEINALRHDAKIWKENEFILPKKLPPTSNPAFNGIYTEIRPLIRPKDKTRYQTLINDLKETSYDSYWNKQLGKPRDQIPGLPRGYNPLEQTCGVPSIKDISLKMLVNPPKTPYEVLWDSQVGHELYRKSHNDYNIGEKINRGYKSNFNPDKRYGSKTLYDPRGIWVRCACEWHKREPVIHSSKIQADYFDRARHKIGKILAPNHNIDRVPNGHTFGIRTCRDMYGLEDLIKDPNYHPCFFKRDFYTWMSSLNKLRLRLKERSSSDFNFDDFYRKLLYYDTEKCGTIPLDIFYEVCECNRIAFNRPDIEALMKVMNVICDCKIDYGQFLDLVNVNKPSIGIIHFDDIPRESLYYVTSTQSAACDYLIINNAEMPPAGIPSIRTDLDYPQVPAGGVKADLENMSDETTAGAVLNPSIYEQYGVNYKDFFMPRTKETIRNLFEKIGYHFPGDTFETLWQKGVEIDDPNVDKVCVETFKKLCYQHFPPKKLVVDEYHCENLS